MTDLRYSRRAVFGLAGTGAVGAGLLLAGCAPGSSADDSGSGDSGSGGTSGGSGSGSGGLSSTPVRVAALSDIPVGGSLAAKAGDQELLLSQPTAGTVHAFSAICTHQGCTVAAGGKTFACPCHGSTFDLSTGKPLSGPALKPLPEYTATVSGDDVSVSS